MLSIILIIALLQRFRNLFLKFVLNDYYTCIPLQRLYLSFFLSLFVRFQILQELLHTNTYDP